MKKTTILNMVYAVLFCVLLVFLLDGGREDGAIQAGPQPDPGGTSSARGAFRVPRLESPGREVVETLVAEDGNDRVDRSGKRKPPRLKRQREPGVLRGHIVDRNGNRLPRGRVLVFRKAYGLEPVAQADIEGAEREYRCCLPAGKVYYAAVDPLSIEGLGVPPLSRGFTRAKRGSDGSILLNEYSRARVVIREGKTVRQDFSIAMQGDVVGRLLDEHGEPLPGVVARIRGLGAKNGGSMQDGTTDKDGVFRLHHLFPGSYRLGFWRPVDFDGFQPPLPTDFVLREGEERDLGDIQVLQGTCAVRGIVVDQDGRPFPGLPIACFPSSSGEDQKSPFDLGDVIRRTRTGADGAFELNNLPAIFCQVSLTPGYEPRGVGTNQVAFWEPSVEVHLTSKQPVVDIGVHVVQQSRPFRLEGRLLEKFPGSHQGFRATVSQGEGQSLPEGVRRSTLRRKPVDVDWETGTYRCLVETPRPEIELRFELEGYEDRVFLIQPEPRGVWTQDIAIPQDFTTPQ